MKLPTSLSVAVACALVSVPSAQIVDGVACLDGTQEVPPVTTPATGKGRFTLDLVSLELSYNISYSGLLGTPTLAHFHLGDCGTSGPIEIGLAPASPIVGSVGLTPAQAADALAGDWYVNIHSTLFPAGEIRGNLDFDGASSCVACGLASCAMPDNLTGPCWDPSTVDLPLLDAIDLPAAGLCWNACNPLPKEQARIQFSPPSPVICGQFLSQVTVVDSAGGVVLSGVATLDYTRTWEERATPPLDREYQVWRFAAKIDFGEAAGAAPVCYNPPCLGPAPAHPTSFWYGYVDYAQNCFTGNFENALALFHNCDDFIHNPFLSDRPGAFHPVSSYALVAPDTPVNPFVPTVLTPRSGPVVAEAVRNVDHFLVAGACTKEDVVSQGVLQLLGTACLCPIGFVPAQQSASHFEGATFCGSSWLSLNLFNTTVGFNWFELIATSLGTWTTGGSYPGPESAFAEEAFLLYNDSCAAAAGAPPFTLDFVYGAKTMGGYDVVPVPIGPPVTQDFLDLASNYSEPGVVLPLLGSVGPTDHLIYVNTP